VLDPETGVGAYQISGGASGGVLIVALAMAVIIGSFIATSIFAATIFPILVGGLFSYIAMKSYVGNIEGLVKLNKSGVISNQQFNDSINFISTLTIIAGAIGIRGKYKGDALAVLDQAYIAMFNFFVKITTITSNQ
jgi:general stress protein CsbA